MMPHKWCMTIWLTVTTLCHYSGFRAWACAWAASEALTHLALGPVSMYLSLAVLHRPELMIAA
jgi:hypothetical protein